MMKVNVIFAGLHKDNIDTVLKRMEAMLDSLKDSVICALNFGSMDCLEELKNWLGRHAGSQLHQRNCDSASDLYMVHVADMFCDAHESDLILVAPTEAGKRLGQRLAARRGQDCLADVLHFEEVDQRLRAVRKIYSTHIEGLFLLNDQVVLASQSGTKVSWEEKPAMSEAAFVEYEDDMDWEEISYLLEEEKLLQVEDLSKAKVVFLGGKGLGSKENFERMEALAKKLGASSGCTRAVAMAGWASYDQVVGISGWKLQADVCIAFGVSGAGPLLQGLEGVGRLTAVNNDKKAPIFRHADYGVVEDCMKILEAMES